MNNSDSVTKLYVIENGENESNLFDTDMEYIIPLYQRAYAWEDKQLLQLIDDIRDVSEDTDYYIGTLIVSKQGNKYEVVDGQQRLTSLFLLLNCLGIDVNNTLTFACRDKSNYTLKNVKELIHEDRSKIDMDNIEPGIQHGLKILMQELCKLDEDNKDKFIRKLSRVVLYRIEVPEHTDLNRYFEIMNTRGEQLEQHDILKAALMSYLPVSEQPLFAQIWDACSDMTGYVQMHFISQENKTRTELFGDKWDKLPEESFQEYVEKIHSNSDVKGAKINDIIRENDEVKEEEGYLDDEIRVRFDSIIDFPYFLLHTLKVFIETEKISHINESGTIVAELLDDKKLKSSFDNVIEFGCLSGKRININKAEFSREFIMCLLRTRFIFDKYIIKREYANDNSDGEWSLKSLSVSVQKSKKKPYYRNTSFEQGNECDNTNNDRNKSNIMIQSALRVSYTSPKAMHWITELLVWLSEEKYSHIDDNKIINYTAIAEKIAQKSVKDNFLDKCSDGVYSMGVNTPHIVFNYLDYLIWSKERKKYNDFTFEFRNSVEHWYPRNPSEGTFEQWSDGVDSFGNLCIIQRNINSKFSNMSPEAKKSTFEKMISKGSLKLRKMSDLTQKDTTLSASLNWKNNKCKEHEEEMISLLKGEKNDKNI